MYILFLIQKGDVFFFDLHFVINRARELDWLQLNINIVKTFFNKFPKDRVLHTDGVLLTRVK